MIRTKIWSQLSQWRVWAICLLLGNNEKYQMVFASFILFHCLGLCLCLVDGKIMVQRKRWRKSISDTNVCIHNCGPSIHILFDACKIQNSDIFFLAGSGLEIFWFVPSCTVLNRRLNFFCVSFLFLFYTLNGFFSNTQREKNGYEYDGQNNV